MVAILHWIMLAIVGIRIYVGEFAVDTSGATRSFITSPYGVFQCLPAYSLLGHLHHFKQILVSATIFTYQPVFYQWGTFHWKNATDWVHAWKSLIDPVAYVATVFLMLPFVAFAVGAYLQYDVAMDIRDTVQIMAPCFMAFFLLTNLQAAIIFAIIIAVVSAILSVIAIIIALIAAAAILYCTSLH